MVAAAPLPGHPKRLIVTVHNEYKYKGPVSSEKLARQDQLEAEFQNYMKMMASVYGETIDIFMLPVIYLVNK